MWDHRGIDMWYWLVLALLFEMEIALFMFIKNNQVFLSRTSRFFYQEQEGFFQEQGGLK